MNDCFWDGTSVLFPAEFALTNESKKRICDKQRKIFWTLFAATVYKPIYPNFGKLLTADKICVWPMVAIISTHLFGVGSIQSNAIQNVIGVSWNSSCKGLFEVADGKSSDNSEFGSFSAFDYKPAFVFLFD